MAVRGIIGTDYLKVRPDFKVIRNPYGDDDVLIVPAINPDVVVFHAFRADYDGNVVGDNHQNTWLIAQAGRKVIVTVEEVVPPESLVRGSFEVVTTSIHIDAIVHVPSGAHPTPCAGYYGSDGAHLQEYLRFAAGDGQFQQYLDRYVRVGEARYQELVGIKAAEGSRV